jgi:hypothetical protein
MAAAPPAFTGNLKVSSFCLSCYLHSNSNSRTARSSRYGFLRRWGIALPRQPQFLSTRAPLPMLAAGGPSPSPMGRPKLCRRSAAHGPGRRAVATLVTALRCSPRPTLATALISLVRCQCVVDGWTAEGYGVTDLEAEGKFHFLHVAHLVAPCFRFLDIVLNLMKF